MEENLEDLNNMGANEKKEKLQDVLSRIQNLNKDSIVSGKIEIVDISFYRTSENNYVYTILYNEKGPNNEIVERSKSYEEKQGEDGLILEEFDRNSIDDKIKENEEKIESYRALSYDVSELDKDLNDKNEKLKKDKEQLENPKESKNSLLNIERSENYIKDICQALGIKREDLEYYMSINGDESIFKDPEKYYNLAYTGIPFHQLIHSFSVDSFSKYVRDDKGLPDRIATNRINKLMTPDEFLLDSRDYNELIISVPNRYIKEDNEFNNSLKNPVPFALYCYDTITNNDIETAKKYNLGIIVVNTKKYNINNENKMSMYDTMALEAENSYNYIDMDWDERKVRF